MAGPPVDSCEGITLLVDWAKAHGFVLSQAHEAIAKKWGVSTEGVLISQPMSPTPSVKGSEG